MGLLWILASESGKTFGRGELVRRVWGQNVFVTPRTVDVHIASLRKKLGSL
jgi:DNA-binding response OmpR family regulator